MRRRWVIALRSSCAGWDPRHGGGALRERPAGTDHRRRPVLAPSGVCSRTTFPVVVIPFSTRLGPDIYTIGDCVESREAVDAVYEGFEVVRTF